MNIIRRVRLLMMENKTLRKWVEPIQETKILKNRRERITEQVRKKESLKFKACYEAHRGEFEKLFQMLEDDFSRKTLQAVINYRLTLRGGVLKGIVVAPQYFMPDIFGPAENEVFVDGGAYIGDTILSLIKEFGKGKAYYKKIYAWEPDPVNRERLIENCKAYKGIEVLPFGMWSEKTTLSFSTDHSGSSRLSDEGALKVPVDSIDNLCSGEKVTFIKMDIEGSEIHALHGAEKVIKRDKPRLAICIYHKPEHLYEIPFLVKEMVPEYKLYIRHHYDSDVETVLYAVYPPDTQ